MRFRRSALRGLTLWGLFLSLLVPGGLLAQGSTGSLRGQVTDPSGAAVSQATVLATSASGKMAAAQTNQNGLYVIKGLSPGAYTVTVTAPNFTAFEQQGVTVTVGHVQKLDVALQIKQEVQQVTVSAEASHLSVAPETNASAVVIQGKDLAALSDDPDELQAELEALAGPAAGPNGGEIYIDGFSGGELPPKDDILEIHINQNPFSAEYDRVGYGRIEIITKPGSSKYHGGGFIDGNDSAFNSRNPFAAEEPGYHSEFYNGNLGGPISKKASFFFSIFRRNINDTSVINAVVLSPTFAQSPFNQAILNPRTRMNITPRVDYQISSNNVLAIRYQRWTDSAINDGIGQLVLPSQAYNTNGSENTLQISDTQVISTTMVDQTRFQYRHESANQMPQSLQPSISVLGAFTGGGSGQGQSLDTGNSYEVQNLLTIALGKHNLTVGGRLRDENDSNISNENFNGAFTFPTLTAYQITEQGLQQGLTPQQIQAAGGGPNQFAITAGTPLVKVRYLDLGLYAEDTWRMRPNISLSLGLRFETQNAISDHADFAPRMGFAWGLGRGSSPKTILRAGFGIFYDRFKEDQILQAERLNGLNQQQIVVENPLFYPTIPPISTLVSSATPTLPTVYQIDPALQAPYTIQSAIGLERQISRNITTSVTYLNSHGVHQLLTRNINAPVPGTYDPSDPLNGRPFVGVSACGVVNVPGCESGFDGNIYQYESDGLYNQNELIANFNVREGSRLTLFGYYTLNYADSDTAGATSFPSNPYDIFADYGRASFDVRNRALLGGAVGLPFGLQFMPFMMANSGRPFNITLGQDLLGTSVFNQRPAFAASGATGPNIVDTRLGAFNTLPTLGEAVIPINYGTGPGAFALNLHLTKTFGFGEKKGGGHRGGGYGSGGGGGGRHGGLGGRGLSGSSGPNFWGGGTENSRYNLTFGVTVHNIFNNVNLGTPIGNLGSPLFGMSNSLAGGPFSSQSANRRIDLQVRFNF